jgi:WD40 repeat protein
MSSLRSQNIKRDKIDRQGSPILMVLTTLVVILLLVGVIARLRSDRREPDQALESHDHWITSLAWSLDGSRLATGSADREVHIWNTTDWQQIATMRGNGSILSVAWSPDNTQIAASDDSTIYIWDSQTTHRVASISDVYSDLGSKIIWISNSVVVNLSDSVSIISVESSELLTSFPVNNQIWDLNNDKLAFVTDNNSIEVFSLPTFETLVNFPIYPAEILVVSWSPDGCCILSGSADGTARIWQVDGHMQEIEFVHPAPVFAASWSPDGQKLATMSGNLQDIDERYAVHVWDMNTYEQRFIFYHPSDLRFGGQLLWSLDSRFLINNSHSYQDAHNFFGAPILYGAILIWDTDSGQLHDMLHRRALINALSLSPDGTLLATASGVQTDVWVIER